jgi:hypothetical protein
MTAAEMSFNFAFAALTLNPSPTTGEGLSIWLPFSQSGRRGWGMRANLQNWDALDEFQLCL